MLLRPFLGDEPFAGRPMAVSYSCNRLVMLGSPQSGGSRHPSSRPCGPSLSRMPVLQAG